MSPAGFLGGVEDLSKMLGLPRVVRVDDAVGVKFVDAIFDSSEIGGAVEIAAVRFLDDEGGFVGAVDEDDDGAVGFDRDGFGF